jgi:TldD protein
MLDESLVQAVIASAIRRGASFAELYVERWRRRAVRMHNGAVKEATSGIEYGAGLRLFYDTDVAYAYTAASAPKSLSSEAAN